MRSKEALLLSTLTLIAGLFSHHTRANDLTQRFISWVNLPNPGSHEDYLVNVTVNGIDFHHVPVDTGSTGFLIAARSLHYGDETELKKCCQPAFHFLSSSRRFYNGYWLPSTLTFKSATDRVFESSVPVFAVTETGTCSSFTPGNCTVGQHTLMPTGIQYMGVGFGRWSGEQPNATADKNALLNIDFGADKGLRSGYMINDQGLVLGVRSSDYDSGTGWSLTRLTRDLDPLAPKDRPEWNGAPMCVQLADSECLEGTALFDTGINYSFLGVAPGVTRDLNVTDGKFVLLKNGTNLTVRVGRDDQHQSFNFSFTTGDSQNEHPFTPPRVRLVKPHADGAFINTGRFFYNTFSLLFEEEAGIVGLRPNPTSAADADETRSTDWTDAHLELRAIAT